MHAERHADTRSRIVALLALGILALTPSRLLAQWSIEYVDEIVGSPASGMVLDAGGRPIHLLAGLSLARWNGAAWSVESIDPEVCSTTGESIAVDPAGNPSVGYWGDGALRYASWSGTDWRSEVVDPGASFIRASSLAFDLVGRPAIAYITYEPVGSDLKLAKWSGTAWSVETVDVAGADWEGGEARPSLRFDAVGWPVISYHAWTGVVPLERGNLKLATWTGTAWDIQVVDDSSDDVGEYCSLQFDRSGRPAIAYFERTNSKAKYASWDGTSWIIENIGPLVYVVGCSLQFDAAGEPAVAYNDRARPGVTYASRSAGVWNPVVIDDQAGSGASLVLDSTGAPVVGFSRDALRGHELRFARWSGAAFRVEGVALRSGGPASGTSVALDSAGRPGISYYQPDGPIYVLMYAKWNGASWDLERVDTLTDVYSGHTALVFDSADRPLIGYANFDSYEVKLARWSGTVWDIEVVALGPEFSLALDAADNPGICYTSGDLGYAKWNGASWDHEVVEVAFGTGGWFLNCSLALDNSGNPAISYDHNKKFPPPFDRFSVRFAKWNGTGWEREEVDVGAESSLALDSTGNPSLAYYDRYARWNGSTWDIETVGVGIGEPSLKFDLADNPAISYRRFTADAAYVAYAHWNGTTWDIADVDRENRDHVTKPSLTLDASGAPCISYAGECGDVQLACPAVPAILYRGVVTDPSPGWKTPSLPLAAANDDATAPFPLDTTLMSSTVDSIATSSPLTIYRVLTSTSGDTGNRLRVVEDAGRTRVYY